MAVPASDIIHDSGVIERFHGPLGPLLSQALQVIGGQRTRSQDERAAPGRSTELFHPIMNLVSLARANLIEAVQDEQNLSLIEPAPDALRREFFGEMLARGIANKCLSRPMIPVRADVTQRE